MELQGPNQTAKRMNEPQISGKSFRTHRVTSTRFQVSLEENLVYERPIIKLNQRCGEGGIPWDFLYIDTSGNAYGIIIVQELREHPRVYDVLHRNNERQPPLTYTVLWAIRVYASIVRMYD